MPATRIAYRRRGGPSAPRRPWLELYIGGQRIAHYALVDSGADFSLVPQDLADRVGFKWDPSDEREGQAAGSATFKFWVAVNKLSIYTEVGPLVLNQPAIADHDHFIFGRRDFFATYVVTFNERDAWMECSPYDRLITH